MTTQHSIYLDLMKAMAAMPAEDQTRIKATIDKMNAIIAESPTHGMMAVAIIGAMASIDTKTV